MMISVVTLDGPSGVGKGAISLMLARDLGWHILDSGSLYRLVALQAARQTALNDIPRLVAIAEHLNVQYVSDSGVLKIILNNEDVTNVIRQEQVGTDASKIAVISELREALLERQRAFAIAPGLVADGRDMGTTVFPDAGLKIFMTASAKERAKRRHKQLIEKGIGANLPDLVKELEARDLRDSTRSASPLVAAADAVIIDTTDLAIDEVYSEVMELVKKSF